MSGDNVLKEFLVSLGFKVDDATYRKFTEILNSTDGFVKNLAASATGAVTAVDTLVTRVASGMEQVYYSSQRFGASAQNIQGLGFAFRQIGLSSDQAIQSVANLAMAMKNNPGLAGLTAQWGIDPNEDRAKMLVDLYQRWTKIPYPVASREGSMFGQDPATMLAIEQNLDKIQPLMQEWNDKLKAAGVNTDDLGKKSVALDNALVKLDEDFTALKESITADFIGPLTDAVKWLDSLLTKFIQFNKDHPWNIPGVGEVHPAADAAVVAGGAGVGLLAKWGIGRLWSALTGSAAKKAIEDAVSKAVTETGAAAADVAAATPAGSIGIMGLLSRLTAIGTGVYYGGGFYQSTAAPELDELYDKNGKLYAHDYRPRGIRNNNPGNLMGWGGADTDKDGFSVFTDAYSGLVAMTKNLRAYGSKYHLDTVEQIIRRWASSSSTMEQNEYINAVWRRTGFNPFQHLDLNDPATLQKLEMAMIAQENGKMPYDPALIRSAIDNTFSGSGTGTAPVSIVQTNNINVSGAGSPHDTAKAVSDTQQHTNGELVRNLKGYAPW